MDWAAGYESESNARGPTRRRARHVCALWAASPPLAWPHCVCNDGGDRSAGLVLARQPERIPLRGAAGDHVEGAPSAAAIDGAAGNRTTLDCHSHADRLHTFILAVSDYDHLTAVFQRAYHAERYSFPVQVPGTE